MAADLDLLVLAELNPDVLVAAGDVDLRFGQVEQLVEKATITLGSSGAITAAAAAAQGLRVAVCAVVGDDQVGTWVTDLLAAQGVDVTCVVRRPGRATGISVVITRPGGDRAILTFGGTMAEMTAADVPHDRLREAGHVHASSFFLQRGLQADLPKLFGYARVLPNAAECGELAAAFGEWRNGDQNDDAKDNETRKLKAARRAAEALRKLGPAVVVKLGAAGGLLVGPEGVVLAHATAVDPVDTTGAGDCFNAGFIAGLLEGSTPAESLKRAVTSGAIAVTGWGGTGRLATRDEALSAAAELTAERLPDW